MLPFKISLIGCHSMYCKPCESRLARVLDFQISPGVLSLFSGSFSDLVFQQLHVLTEHTHTHTDNTGLCERAEMHSHHWILSVMILQPQIPVELCHQVVPYEASGREVIAPSPKSSSTALQVHEHKTACLQVKIIFYLRQLCVPFSTGLCFIT